MAIRVYKVIDDNGEIAFKEVKEVPNMAMANIIANGRAIQDKAPFVVWNTETEIATEYKVFESYDGEEYVYNRNMFWHGPFPGGF